MVPSVLRRAVFGAAFLLMVPLGPLAAQEAAPAQAPASASDGELLYQLTLLRGRLATARAMIEAGHGAEARTRHLGAALNGRLGQVEQAMEPRPAAPLQAAIDRMTSAAEGGAGDFAAAHEAATAAIGDIEALIPAERRADAAFTLPVLAKAVEHAVDDYDAAVKDGQIVVVKEYEEVWGYIRAAREALHRHLPDCRTAGCAEADAVMTRIEEGIPSVVPTAAPGMTAEEAKAFVAKLHAAAGA